MSCETRPLEPEFAHFGVDGGVNAVAFCDFRAFGSVALVGTYNGKCMAYSLRSLKHIATVFEDPLGRQIVQLGECKFKNTESEISFYVHFRGSSIDFFELVGNEVGHLKFELRKSFSCSHYGFCKAVCWKKEQLFLPDYDNETNVIRVLNKGSENKCYYLAESFLVDAFKKHPQATMNSDQIAKLCPFKGLLMGIEVIDESRAFLAFEDSTIAVFDFSLKRVLDCIKHPKHHQFLCWSIEQSTLIDYVLVSVIEQCFLLSFHRDTTTLSVCAKIKKSKSINCVSSCFLKSNASSALFACALSNGTIEIYSMTKSDYTLEVIQRITFHTGNSIMCMKAGRDEIKQDKDEESLLLVGCMGKKLAVYKI